MLTGRNSPEGAKLFMISDSGWTVYLPVVGDIDPGTVLEGRLLIAQGVPMNFKTQERKDKVRDAIMWQAPKTLWRPSRNPVSESSITELGDPFISRCFCETLTRVEFYTSRKEAFELAIVYSVLEELKLHIDPATKSYEVTGGYRRIRRVS